MKKEGSAEGKERRTKRGEPERPKMERSFHEREME
jgi:hypothetical protein